MIVSNSLIGKFTQGLRSSYFSSSFILLVPLLVLHIIRSSGLLASTHLLTSGNHVPKNDVWNYEILMIKINFLALKRKYGKTLNTATSKIELFVIKHKDFNYVAIVLKSSILDVARLLDRPLITFYPCFQFFLIKFPVSQVIDCFI